MSKSYLTDLEDNQYEQNGSLQEQTPEGSFHGNSLFQQTITNRNSNSNVFQSSRVEEETMQFDQTYIENV